MVEENSEVVEYTFEKIGNQISIEPISFTILKDSENKDSNTAILNLNVTNHGLSD